MIKILHSGTTAMRLVQADGSIRDFTFSAPVARAFVTADERNVLVVTDPPAAHAEANLYCINVHDGSILWQRDADKSISSDNIYTEVKQIDANLVRAWDWNGHRETIEIATGAMVDRSFMK